MTNAQSKNQEARMTEDQLRFQMATEAAAAKSIVEAAAKGMSVAKQRSEAIRSAAARTAVACAKAGSSAYRQTAGQLIGPPPCGENGPAGPSSGARFEHGDPHSTGGSSTFMLGSRQVVFGPKAKDMDSDVDEGDLSNLSGEDESGRILIPGGHARYKLDQDKIDMLRGLKPDNSLPKRGRGRPKKPAPKAIAKKKKKPTLQQRRRVLAELQRRSTVEKAVEKAKQASSAEPSSEEDESEDDLLPDGPGAPFSSVEQAFGQQGVAQQQRSAFFAGKQGQPGGTQQQPSTFFADKHPFQNDYISGLPPTMGAPQTNNSFSQPPWNRPIFDPMENLNEPMDPNLLPPQHRFITRVGDQNKANFFSPNPQISLNGMLFHRGSDGFVPRDGYGQPLGPGASANSGLRWTRQPTTFDFENEGSTVSGKQSLSPNIDITHQAFVTLASNKIPLQHSRNS